MRAITFVVLSSMLATVGWRSSQAEDSCKLTQLASVPVRYEHNRILVEISVQDVPVTFIIDTGASRSEISHALATRLGLQVHTSPGEMYGVAGFGENFWTNVPKLQMGLLVGHNQQFNLDPNFSDGSDGKPVGLFGADFLANYNVEIDLAGGKLSLYTRDNCPDRVVYWAPEYFKVPFTAGDVSVPFLKVPVKVDGQEVHAIVDTGATNSVLKLALARSLLNYDETKTSDEKINVSGVATQKRLVGYKHRFSSLEFGPITLRNPMIDLTPMDIGKGSSAETGSHINSLHMDQPDMLIGMDVISKLRLFIDYRDKALFFTLAPPPKGATATEK